MLLQRDSLTSSKLTKFQIDFIKFNDEIESKTLSDDVDKRRRIDVEIALNKRQLRNNKSKIAKNALRINDDLTYEDLTNDNSINDDLTSLEETNEFTFEIDKERSYRCRNILSNILNQINKKMNVKIKIDYLDVLTCFVKFESAILKRNREAQLRLQHVRYTHLKDLVEHFEI